MDYEVFLVSRIREEVDRHGDTTRAVAEGVFRTAHVIAAAAAIMVTPAVMKLLGHRNWALPRGLDRVLPQVSLEGEPAPTAAR